MKTCPSCYDTPDSELPTDFFCVTCGRRKSLFLAALNDHNNKESTCNWYEGDDGGPWATQCNELFNIENEGPEANGMKFCCFCGKKLVEVVAEAEEGDE